MDNTVRSGNIRRDDIAVVHLHLSVRLLQRQWGSGGHRVLDLIESHSSGEQRSGHQMFRHQFLGLILVRHQVRQLLRREFPKRFISRCEDRVGLDAWKIKDKKSQLRNPKTFSLS